MKNKIGTISTNGKGYGYVTDEKDIGIRNASRTVILPEYVNTALPGDKVEYIVTSEKNKYGEKEGQVVKIVERARTQFVGTILQEEGNVIFKADDHRIYVPMALPKEEQDVAMINKKALVEFEKWEKGMPLPYIHTLKIIGNRGEHEVEMQSIMLDKGVPEDFPDAVLAEAKKIDKEQRIISTEEKKSRRDFSAIPTFTIDPIDAKDFDDAISLKKIGDDLYEVGVHIADVSHYVRPGTALDDEALSRATSIYMVDRVVPMLPEILSNDLCSLNPKEERRTFSAVFEMNSNGDISSRWFGKSIINSHHRFSYEGAQDVLDGKSDIFKEEMFTLNKLAYKLREKKFEGGAIDFDTEEVKFVLDAQGVPIKVVKKIRGDTHKLVEDFMLLANREVAAFLSKAHEKQNMKGIYRVHASPAEDRLADLAMLYKALGYDIKKIQTAKDITRLLEKIAGTPEESLLKTATIRSMAKAIYATSNTGHFGLAFEYYTHFTSPIRRYPDLEVHRLMDAVLTDNKKEAKHEIARLENIATHSTEKEIAAADAERTSIKYKQVEYMSKFIGQEFEGIVTGVTEWGIFIEEKETKCEGLVRLKEMRDDKYMFEEKLFRVVGTRTKKKISLGDEVKFKVIAANLETRTLDYALV